MNDAKEEAKTKESDEKAEEAKGYSKELVEQVAKT